MCPDHQILSVYLDKELPSPWKEKMEEHLSNCPACRGLLESYKTASVLAASTVANTNKYILPASERVWENLSRMGVREKEVKVHHTWKRSVSLPLPAAIAAALLIAVLAAYIGGPLVHNTPQINTIANLDAQGVIPASDITRVIQYLEAQENSSNMVIIRLPESQNFRSAGEPTIIRAADYSRGDFFR